MNPDNLKSFGNLDNKSAKIEVLDALPEDAESIAEVEEASWLTTYPGKEGGVLPADIPPHRKNSPEKVAKYKETIEDKSGTAHIWTAKDGNKMVGFCKAIKTLEKNEIDLLYILEKYQKKGIGLELINKAFEWIGKDKDIVLTAWRDNQDSIRFYEKLGFKKTDKPEERISYPSGSEIFLIEMKREKS